MKSNTYSVPIGKMSNRIWVSVLLRMYDMLLHSAVTSTQHVTFSRIRAVVAFKTRKLIVASVSTIDIFEGDTINIFCCFGVLSTNLTTSLNTIDVKNEFYFFYYFYKKRDF